MKKIFTFFGVAGLFLFAACSGQKEDNSTADSLADLSAQYEEATTFNDSLMLLMGDIYTGLDSINTQEGLLYTMGTGDNVNRRAEIKSNLQNIRARLAANRDLLAQMEKKLNTSDSKNAVLVKTINQLKAHIEQQDKKIADLEAQLANANTQIETLNTQVEETQEQVRTEVAAKEEAQAQTTAVTNELNTVYYAIGSNKELKNNGLLSKKFLGSTKVLKGNFNASYFTKADKRNLRSIPTNAKKVKIWSNMPADSYNIVDNPNGTKTIEITDPAKFWSLSNHLIIQIN